MAVPLSITILFVVSYFTYFIQKRMSFLQNSILFMLTAILIKNYITILSMELKLVKTTEDPILFLYLLLYRELIMPLVIILFINIYFQITRLKKLMLFIVTVLLLQIMDALSVYFGVIHYIKWNAFLELLANICFLLLGLGISKLLLFLSNRDGKRYDNNL